MMKFRKKTQEDEDELSFESKKIKDDLSDIYDNSEDEEEIDMETLDKNPKGRLKTFFATLLSCSFLIFIIIVVVWVISNRPQEVKEDGVVKSIVLTVDYPKSISSGEKISYKVYYENKDNVDMTKMQLLLSYPDGFIFESATINPDNSLKNIFTLPNIAPFEKGEIEIIGRLVGSEGTNKPLLVSLSYEPANFSSEFQELATAQTEITSAAVVIDIIGNEMIIPEKDLEYKIMVKNNSLEAMDSLRLIVIYPEMFTAKEFDPKPKDGVEIIGLDFGAKYNVWNIASLDIGESKEISLSGIFSSSINQDQNIIVRAEIGNDTNGYNLIAENYLAAKNIGKDINLNLILNGANNIQTVSSGSNLGYSITYENQGTSDLKNIEIRSFVKAYQGDKEVDMVDWSTFRDENNGKEGNGEILWTSDEILKLSSFSAKEEGTIDFFVNLKPIEDILQSIDHSDGEIVLKSWVEMKVGLVGETQTDMIVKSNEIKVTVDMGVVFNSEARYFNDDNIAVGSGPLPPKVGEDTKYRIFWSIDNSFNDISDVIVKATLPANVSWSEKANSSLGSVSFDVGTREVSWKINNLPGTDSATLDFEVGINPSEEDRNKILILLSQAVLSATNTKSGTSLSSSDKALTTDLEDDPITSGRGLVE